METIHLAYIFLFTPLPLLVFQYIRIRLNLYVSLGYARFKTLPLMAYSISVSKDISFDQGYQQFIN